MLRDAMLRTAFPGITDGRGVGRLGLIRNHRSKDRWHVAIPDRAASESNRRFYQHHRAAGAERP
jgi:hypothetical protein